MDEFLVIVLALFGLVLPVVLFGAIFRKAGYSFWLGLVMLVPVVNLVWLVIFATAEWPIERRLTDRRVQSGEADVDDIAAALAEAARRERVGDWQQAAEAYERIAQLPDHPNRQYAAQCAAQMRARLARAQQQ